jgi:hypothetical protein
LLHNAVEFDSQDNPTKRDAPHEFQQVAYHPRQKFLNCFGHAFNSFGGSNLVTHASLFAAETILAWNAGAAGMPLDEQEQVIAIEKDVMCDVMDEYARNGGASLSTACSILHLLEVEHRSIGRVNSKGEPLLELVAFKKADRRGETPKTWFRKQATGTGNEVLDESLRENVIMLRNDHFTFLHVDASVDMMFCVDSMHKKIEIVTHELLTDYLSTCNAMIFVDKRHAFNCNNDNETGRLIATARLMNQESADFITVVCHILSLEDEGNALDNNDNAGDANANRTSMNPS